MPPARYATAEPRRQARTARSSRHQRPSLRWDAGRSQIRRVRWDRVGRVALVLVLAVVMGLYVQHAVAYLSARSQADQAQAVVTQLERQNAALVQRQQQLNDPATIVRDARALGMVWEGERPYAVTGLPGH